MKRELVPHDAFCRISIHPTAARDASRVTGPLADRIQSGDARTLATDRVASSPHRGTSPRISEPTRTAFLQEITTPLAIHDRQPGPDGRGHLGRQDLIEGERPGPRAGTEHCQLLPLPESATSGDKTLARWMGDRVITSRQLERRRLVASLHFNPRQRVISHDFAGVERSLPAFVAAQLVSVPARYSFRCCRTYWVPTRCAMTDPPAACKK